MHIKVCSYFVYLRQGGGGCGDFEFVSKDEKVKKKIGQISIRSFLNKLKLMNLFFMNFEDREYNTVGWKLNFIES